MSAKHVLCSWLYLPLCLGHQCHLPGLLVLEAHLPQDPQPNCSLSKVVWAQWPLREEMLNSVFIPWFNYPKPDNSWDHTLLERSLPMLISYPSSSLLSVLALRLRSRQIKAS